MTNTIQFKETICRGLLILFAQWLAFWSLVQASTLYLAEVKIKPFIIDYHLEIEEMLFTAFVISILLVGAILASQM